MKNEQNEAVAKNTSTVYRLVAVWDSGRWYEGKAAIEYAKKKGIPIYYYTGS